MFNIFKKKTKNVNWKWITKQYRKLGQYRIYYDTNLKQYIGEIMYEKILGWFKVKSYNKYEDVLSLIYFCRFQNFIALKRRLRSQTKITKFNYIPPKVN